MCLIQNLIKVKINRTLSSKMRPIRMRLQPCHSGFSHLWISPKGASRSYFRHPGYSLRPLQTSQVNFILICRSLILLLIIIGGLNILLKDHLIIYVRACVWVLYSIQLVRMSVFKAVLHCFDYHGLVVSFETKTCEYSLLFFQVNFSHSASFEIPY